MPPCTPEEGPIEISSTMIVAPIVNWIIITAVDSACATYEKTTARLALKEALSKVKKPKCGQKLM